MKTLVIIAVLVFAIFLCLVVASVVAMAQYIDDLENENRNLTAKLNNIHYADK